MMADVAAALTDSLSRTGDGGMSVPILFPDGTVSLPSIAFTNEPDTGMYLALTGRIGFSIDGVEAMEIQANALYQKGTSDSAVRKRGVWTMGGVQRPLVWVVDATGGTSQRHAHHW
jgi:hypothetical protein